jgi:hypothetical protein
MRSRYRKNIRRENERRLHCLETTFTRATAAAFSPALFYVSVVVEINFELPFQPALFLPLFPLYIRTYIHLSLSSTYSLLLRRHKNHHSRFILCQLARRAHHVFAVRIMLPGRAADFNLFLPFFYLI